MSFSFNMKADTKSVNIYSAGVQAKLKIAVKKCALAVQALAASTAPVDTGALKNSIEAEGSNLNWTVHDGVFYGIFNELGTSRGISAKHFLGGACEKEAEKFFDDVREALR